MNEVPTGGLTDRQLKFSYWYVSHKLSLRKWLVIFLIIVSALLYFFVGWQIISYALNYQEHKQLQNYLLFTSDPALSRIEGEVPQNLGISNIQVFSAGGVYDYVAAVANGNKEWLAEFDYRFVAGTTTSQYKRGFALPGETADLMEFSQADSQPNLQIANVTWTRIGNYQALKNKMDYFTVENDKLEIGQGKDPSELSLDITNNSPYSYWNTDVQVMLYSGGTTIGVNHVIVSQLKSGEKRAVNLLWNHSLPSGVTYEIKPVVNFLDSKNIMPVGE